MSDLKNSTPSPWKRPKTTLSTTFRATGEWRLTYNPHFHFTVISEKTKFGKIPYDAKNFFSNPLRVNKEVFRAVKIFAFESRPRVMCQTIPFDLIYDFFWFLFKTKDLLKTLNYNHFIRSLRQSFSKVKGLTLCLISKIDYKNNPLTLENPTDYLTADFHRSNLKLDNLY